MYQLLLIEKLFLYSFLCLFVLNNAKSVTDDTDFSLTYDLVKRIVKDEIKTLAEELESGIKRVDDRFAVIEQQIRDLKAVSAEDTSIENDGITAEPFSKSDKEQLDKFSTVSYKTVAEEKQLIRNTIVGLEHRMNGFEKTVTDLSNDIMDIRRLVTTNAEQNNVNGVNVDQLKRSMEETRADSVKKTREIANNILRLQTFVGSSFKTIQGDICIIPTVIDDKMTIQTVHTGTQLAASSEVSLDTNIILDCGKTNIEPSNRIIRCDKAHWVYESPESWASGTTGDFPKCSVYCKPSAKLLERSEKLFYKHGERFECGKDYRSPGDRICQNGEWTSEPDCLTDNEFELRCEGCLKDPGDYVKQFFFGSANEIRRRCEGCEEGIPRDCQDFKEVGYTYTGVYAIFPRNGSAFSVYCDMDTDGGGWTVIQRRVYASDFYKTWYQYKIGFGDLNDNFWLGNEKIYTLTSSDSYYLRVDLTTPDGETGYATYSSFSIGSDADKYRLSIDGYSGNIGDSLVYHNGMAFTTKNRDNDVSHRNCAVAFSGGWWYRDCHYSNLNGMYGNSVFGKGLNWESWKGFFKSMTTTQLSIKRV